MGYILVYWNQEKNVESLFKCYDWIQKDLVINKKAYFENLKCTFEEDFDYVIVLFWFKVGKKFCFVSLSSLRPNFPSVLFFTLWITYLASIQDKPVCNCMRELYPYSGTPLKSRVSWS